MLEADILIKDAEGYRLAGPLLPLAIPATLQDSLMARLDRLAPVREISQIRGINQRDGMGMGPARAFARSLRVSNAS